jgi:hypothetical protein
MSRTSNSTAAPTIPSLNGAGLEREMRQTLAATLSQLRRDTLAFARAMFAALGDEAAIRSTESLWVELLAGVADAVNQARALDALPGVSQAGSDAAASALAALELAEAGIQMIVSSGYGGDADA